MMRASDIILKKRDNKELTREEITSFLTGYVKGEIPDYQVSALLMAIFFRGLSPKELSVWAEAMLNSGEVLDLSSIPGIKVDKHSTGGVGDKVSLTLAPLAVACGIPVPMISGRGLGHTGGTLDKLESIPGFRVDLDNEHFIAQVKSIGVCLIGQTENVAPADKLLYALRDVTGTVESIPLIASSIMSKKLAEGLDALVLDVKVGSGAFMKTLEQARELADTMIGIGTSMGKKVTAFLTNMEQPLGWAVGNSLETIEAIEALKGRGPSDYVKLTRALVGEMLILGGKAQDSVEADQLIQGAIDDGSCLQVMRDCIKAQFGDPRVVDDYSLFDVSPDTYELRAAKDGVISSFYTSGIGIGAMMLGAGRKTMDDVIDPGVGLMIHKKLGDPVKKNEAILTIYHRNGKGLDEAIGLLNDSFTISETGPEPLPLIYEKRT